MTDKLLRERLGYLSDEFDHRSISHLRSISPHHGGSRSPRRHSRSPRPSQTELPVHDSRPDVTPWPALIAERASEEMAQLKASLVSTKNGATRGRETELKQKIQTLEDTVAEYERQKQNVMGTFSEYRERVAERERKLEAEYSTKIISLSEEVLGAKKDFETRMKSFQTLQDKFEREKQQALENLKQEHQKEIQLMEQRFSQSQLLNLEQKYMIEIQRLEEERKSLRAEKERLSETFESKLRRAQTLYETELSAAKMLYSKELEALRDHEEALKEELMARQDEFHDRLQELQHQTQLSKKELANCKSEVAALEKRLEQKEAEVAAISKELEEARTETNQALEKLSKVEHELQETKQMHREQEQQLHRKSNLLHIVETAKSKLEAVIKDLQVEVKALKEKVEFLEKERSNLQSQSESQSQLQNSQVQALEAVLESVTKEKETTKEHYDNSLEQERAQAEERELAMKKEFGNKLNEIEEQYTALKEHFDSRLFNERETIRKTVEGELAGELISIRENNERLLSELEKWEAKGHSEDEQIDGETPTDAEITEIKAGEKRLTDQMRRMEEELEKRKLEQFDDQCHLSHQRHTEELKQITQNIRSEIILELKGTEDEGLQNEIDSLKAKITQLEKSEMVEIPVSSNCESATSTHLKEKIESMEAQLDEKTEAVNSLQTKLDETLQNQQKQIRDETEELEKKNEQKQTKICDLLATIDTKQKYIDQQQNQEAKLREDIERELRSKFAEAAAENHVAEVEAFEKQLQDFKEQFDAKEREQAELIVAINEESDMKDEQIESLHKRVKELMSEVDNIQMELDKKTLELKNFSKKTDEYIRKRERQQNNALEKKLALMKSEHEQTVLALQKQETELIQQLEQLKSNSTSVDCSDPAKVVEMETELKAKDELIVKLQNDLSDHCCKSGAGVEANCSVHDRRKDRSQSLAVVPDANRRPAGKFQCLLNFTKSEKKSNSKSTEKLNVVAIDPKSRDKSPSTSLSKSPSFFSRWRERSPGNKSKSPVAPDTPTSSKNLLSPSDAKQAMVSAERRQSSPLPRKSLNPRPPWRN